VNTRDVCPSTPWTLELLKRRKNHLWGILKDKYLVSVRGFQHRVPKTFGIYSPLLMDESQGTWEGGGRVSFYMGAGGQENQPEE
jgi:hypothetical protein